MYRRFSARSITESKNIIHCRNPNRKLKMFVSHGRKEPLMTYFIMEIKNICSKIIRNSRAILAKIPHRLQGGDYFHECVCLSYQPK